MTIQIAREKYIFDASEGTIEFIDYFSAGVALEKVILIVNAKTNQIMYGFADPSQGESTVSGNVLTLAFDTSSMDDDDPLTIFYRDEDVPLQTVLASRIAGEDLVNDWLRVLVQSNWQRITTTGTTVIKSSPGKIIAIVCATPAANASLTVYDNTAASGTVKGVATLPATLLSDGLKSSFLGGAKMDTGITVVTSTVGEWWVFWQ